MNTHKTTHKERGATAGPRTEAGQALLHDLQNGYQPVEGYPESLRQRIAAIEAEGRQQAVREISERLMRHPWLNPDEVEKRLAGLNASESPPHVHEWVREYAPNYRQASEADDWREECACGAFRTGVGDASESGQPSEARDE